MLWVLGEQPSLSYFMCWYSWSLHRKPCLGLSRFSLKWCESPFHEKTKRKRDGLKGFKIFFASCKTRAPQKRHQTKGVWLFGQTFPVWRATTLFPKTPFLVNPLRTLLLLGFSRVYMLLKPRDKLGDKRCSFSIFVAIWDINILWFLLLFSPFCCLVSCSSFQPLRYCFCRKQIFSLNQAKHTDGTREGELGVVNPHLERKQRQNKEHLFFCPSLRSSVYLPSKPFLLLVFKVWFWLLVVDSCLFQNSKFWPNNLCFGRLSKEEWLKIVLFKLVCFGLAWPRRPKTPLI